MNHKDFSKSAFHDANFTLPGHGSSNSYCWKMVPKNENQNLRRLWIDWNISCCLLQSHRQYRYWLEPSDCHCPALRSCFGWWQYMEVPMGQPGELCVKGPQVMKDMEPSTPKTEKVFYNGWLRTGWHCCRQRQWIFKLWIVKRYDSGFRIQCLPNEIEDVVIQHPGVLEVAAVGVPDEKSGEVVKIFVVKKKDPTFWKRSHQTLSWKLNWL